MQNEYSDHIILQSIIHSPTSILKWGWNAHEFILLGWGGDRGKLTLYIDVVAFEFVTKYYLTKLHCWNLDFIIIINLFFNNFVLDTLCVQTMGHYCVFIYRQPDRSQIFRSFPTSSVQGCPHVRVLHFFRTFHNIFPAVALFTLWL